MLTSGGDRAGAAAELDGAGTATAEPANAELATAGPATAPATEAEIVGTLARRDRLRLARAQAEILALRKENRTSLQALLTRGIRFIAPRRMAALAQTTDIMPSAMDLRPRALVIDHHWPTPSRDSGSIDIVNLVQALAGFGFDVLLAASETSGPSSERAGLEAMGIKCLHPEADGAVDAYLRRHGAALDLCVLCRVYCGGAFLETVQRFCGKARIIFNTVDLHYLREERRARLFGDRKLLAALPALRAREEHLIHEADATILVSEAEMQVVAASDPTAFCLQMPLARPILPPKAGFGPRRGIGFVGGFAHAPNLDAVQYFLTEIWPLVLAELPDCTFSIVGADFPERLLEGCPGEVRYLGHLPELGPWLESLRLTVAPLRFGAGAKGKIASSLAAGLPAAVSEVAAEGMALQAGGVLIAQDPAAFARNICRLHEDPALWARLSGEALRYAQRNLSLGPWQQKLGFMLRRLGF